MGILRTILALAVVIFHSHELSGIGMTKGRVSVQAFYIISGFYMALILNEKYTGKGSYKLFITNRLLRIYPVYWVVLVAALLVSLVGYYGFGSPYYLSRYISYSGCLHPFSIACFVMENIIIVGQDILFFLGIGSDCHLFFTKFPLSESQTAFNYMLVPQAWSVSLELMFYAIAPFLVRRHWTWQILLVMASLGLRFWMMHAFYLTMDPWTYRFFPLELAFFMAGSLAYRYYKTLEKKVVSNYVGYGLLAVCALCVIFFDEPYPGYDSKKWVFYGLELVSLPFIFKVFKENRFDRWIGELSFSLYISHHLIVMVLRQFFYAHPDYMAYYGYAAVAVSLLVALVLNRLVVEPLNRKREKRILG
ncbi:MAG: acyltransferase [Bacteroidetes bacterium]|nr:acyltransferase [Bacteroidota bacterium]